jgi:hypothetical protein
MALGLAGSGIITGFDSASDGFGRVLQVVRATDVTDRSTTSTSFVDVTGMSVTITPQKSTSAIILISSFVVDSRTGGTETQFRLQITDSSNNTISGAENLIGGIVNWTRSTTAGLTFAPITIIAYATPATTSAVTYKTRFKVNEATTDLKIANGGTTGQMYAIEVAA